MAISAVEICNLALSRLGEKRIASLDEKTKEANECSLFYERDRRAALRAHPWSFATVVETLAPLATAEADYDYAYQKPAGCLRVVKIPNVNSNSPDDTTKFKVRGQKILTDQEAATLEYIQDVEDPNNFDEQFIEALSYRLAMDLALSLTGKLEKLQAMASIYNDMISQAATSDASEEREDMPESESYLDARA